MTTAQSKQTLMKQQQQYHALRSGVHVRVIQKQNRGNGEVEGKRIWQHLLHTALT